MSTWYEVEAEEIDVANNMKEVSFFVCNDDNGRIYLSLSFDQIQEIVSRIEKPNAPLTGAAKGENDEHR